MKATIGTCLTAILVALILSGSAIFISTQYNRSQQAIANTNAKAQKDAAQSIGKGICETSTRQFTTCGFIGQ